ncbi:MAG: hypothetical protein PQJ59_07420 [Spirochaetales bacterium]|nr:hypothetical protein [Spirochaetales bacterium]
MNKYTLPSLLFILLITVFGCQTVEGKLNQDDYKLPLGENPVEEDQEELPLPGFVYSLYAFSEVIIDEIDDSLVNLPLPEFHSQGEESPVPVEIASAPAAVVPATVTAPVVTKEPVLTEEENRTVEAEIVDLIDLSSEGEKAEPVYRSEEKYPTGEIALVILEDPDWFYLGEGDGQPVDFKDRTILDGKTLFTFEFPRAGTYTLVFQRQDLSKGESEEAAILAEVLDDYVSVAEVDSPEEEEIQPQVSEESSDVQKETPANILSAEKRLDQIDEDPDKVEETLELLEFLLDAASDDESLAEYYYRMARTLEMNTRFQDLRKAYETYQYIEDTFFLTDYYEKSVERIRYLDRHFFKLR